jgi:hypothetical protein
MKNLCYTKARFNRNRKGGNMAMAKKATCAAKQPREKCKIQRREISILLNAQENNNNLI